MHRDLLLDLLAHPDLPETLRLAVAAALSDADTIVDAAPDEAAPHGAPAGPRYADRGVLGSGGMGEVRRAYDTVLRREIAMKVLRTDRTHTALRDRFVEEAQATAQLAHPGIVPVHDLGTLPDGRPFFTMREIRGRTLTEVIDEVHDAGGQPSASGWTFRRLIQAFHTVCETVAYAHARGVLHRDLKPDNVLVGAFGEVLVADWGLAMVQGTAADTLSPVSTVRMDDDAGRTGVGRVMGTPDFMPPEQAIGARDQLGPHSDVWALGAILYAILSGGHPPHGGGAVADVLRRVRTEEVLPLPPTRLPQPDELVEVCLRALRRAPADRYLDAGALAAAVDSWLEGARQRELALAQVDAALPLSAEADALRVRAAALRERAARQLEQIAAHAPPTDKAPAWELEDEAGALEREAERRLVEMTLRLRAALVHAPELPEATDALAALYRQQHERAEDAHNAVEAARYEALLRAHDRGAHADYLRGEGTVDLDADPPGATARLFRFVARQRHLVPVHVRDLGPAPIRGLVLPTGSWLVELSAPGRRTVRYPVWVRRNAAHDATPPGADRPAPVRLPRADALGPDDLVVPAGWFHSGGDAHAIGSLPARRVWVDGFAIRRGPVTNREYIAFLDDLVDRGRLAEALEYAPRERGRDQASGAQVYGRTADGHFALQPDLDGDVWDPDWPVLMVDWHCADAYATWLAARTGQPWRLPRELEWEKAARGVDGRAFPWGDHFDPSFANTRDGHAGRPLPAAVDAHPIDESPYGVRMMCGGAREWCDDPYLPQGPALLPGDRLPPWTPDPSPADRALRGGSWLASAGNARTATRMGHVQSFRIETTGFRVARSLDP